MDTYSELTRIPMPGDGNCLFSSLSYCLYGTIDYHLDIRYRISEYVSENWEMFQYFVIGMEGYIDIHNANEYELYMKKDGVYGGYVELSAASEIYEKHIVVFNETNGSKTDFYPNFKTKILLSYTGDGYGGHYEVLLPPDQEFKNKSILNESNFSLENELKNESTLNKNNFGQEETSKNESEMIESNTDNEKQTDGECVSNIVKLKQKKPRKFKRSLRKRAKCAAKARWSETHLIKEMNVSEELTSSLIECKSDFLQNNNDNLSPSYTSDVYSLNEFDEVCYDTQTSHDSILVPLQTQTIVTTTDITNINSPITNKTTMETNTTPSTHNSTVNENLSTPINESELPALSVEFTNKSTDIINEGIQVGNRIVNVTHFLKALQTFPHFPYFNCQVSDIYIKKENLRGFQSYLHICCKVCNAVSTITCTPTDSNSIDINTAAVGGAMLSGGGYTTLAQVFSKMDVPVPSTSTYSEHHSQMCEYFFKAAQQHMYEAAELEREIAVAKGNVGVDGIPEITVVVDGSWCKRSYRQQYDSLGGLGAIIGYESKRVLFIAIKNKYCMICAKAENLNKAKTSNKTENINEVKPPPPHTCFKNWDRNKPSSQMEAEAIKEGFCMSEKLYKLRYVRFIGDGDSSVYNSIIKSKPYGDIKVTKLECTNHLLRNYCNKIKALTQKSSQRNKSTVSLKKILAGNIFTLRGGIKKAIEHRKKEGINDQNIKLLQKDILNAPYHVFGNHINCDKYFCKGGQKENEINLVPKLKAHGIFQEIMVYTRALAIQSDSLIHFVNNNSVENYNSVVCGLIAGKRINYTGRQSYDARCHAAVMKYASQQPFYETHKIIFKKSPAFLAKKIEMQNRKKILKKASLRVQRREVRRKLFHSKDDNKYYGSNCNRPDMSVEKYLTLKEAFLESLRCEDREKLENITRGQGDNEAWLQERKKRLTASNFGIVCSCKDTTNTANKVKNILYGNIDNESTRYGHTKEEEAKVTLQKYLTQQRGYNVTISECGLFTHKDHPFLAASPDGVIDKDEIIEIKCPYSARNLSPDEAIAQKKVTFWKKGKNSITWNKNHNYYFQIQGQLEISERKVCVFALWTPKGLKVDFVQRDSKFWKEKMENKLINFYYNCLLPEILDSRKERSLPIRDMYIDGIELYNNDNIEDSEAK